MANISTAFGSRLAHRRALDAISVLDERQIAEAFSLRKSWEICRLVLRLSSNFRFGRWSVFTLNLMIAAITAVSPYALRYTIDSAMAGVPFRSFMPVALTLTASVLVLPRLILPWLRETCANRYLQPPLEKHLTDSAVGVIASSDIARGENLGNVLQPVIMNGCNEIWNILDTLTRDTASFICGIGVCGYFGYIAFINPAIGCAILLGVALYAVFAWLQARSTHPLFNMQQKMKTLRDSTLISVLNRVCKTWARTVHDDVIGTDLLPVTEKYRAARHACKKRWVFWSNGFRDSSMVLANLIVYAMSIWYLTEHEITVGTVGMLMMMAQMADDPVKVAATALERLLIAGPMINAYEKICVSART